MYTDFVIQLKNASLAHKRTITVPHIKLHQAIAKALVKDGFLEKVSEETIEGRKMLSISLRYQHRKPAITDVTIISKPSLRVYIGADEIATKQGRAATFVLSTNQGVMTGREAMKKKAGGELLFKIS
jgi:small subunit ribosomal protein S8